MTKRPPFGAEELFARLDALGIAFTNHSHPPVFTVEEARALRGELPGAHVKNLFLRDKKRRLFLVTVEEERRVDLKALRRRLGAAGSFSFADAGLLRETLGVEPGAVTPLGVVNDREGRVAVVLDRSLLSQDPINAHPLRNDMTTALSPDGLLRFLEAENHPPHTDRFRRARLKRPRRLLQARAETVI